MSGNHKKRAESQTVGDPGFDFRTPGAIGASVTGRPRQRSAEVTVERWGPFLTEIGSRHQVLRLAPEQEVRRCLEADESAIALDDATQKFPVALKIPELPKTLKALDDFESRIC